MAPQVGPLPGYLVGWIIAALLGGTAALWLLQRAGLSDRQIAIAFFGRVALLLAGSKLLYLAENWPAWIASREAALSAIGGPQMRIPGGILLVIAVGPVLARLTRVPYLTLADAVAPAAGLLIFGVRIGCFLQG